MKKLLLLCVFTVVYSLISAQPITIYWTSSHEADSVNSFYKRDTALYITALDLKFNLSKATGLSFIVSDTPVKTTNLPTTGIVLMADETHYTDNRESCDITCNGTDFLTFTATYNHGVRYGVYEYLHQLGFRFYLPDTLWEIIPTITSPFDFTTQTIEPKMSIRNPALTGGIGYSPVDSTKQSNFAWYQWLDRNNMRGEYEIAGHNDWALAIREKMNSIPCSIAEHDESLKKDQGNVPNIDNPDGLNAWGSWMAENWISIALQTANDPWVNYMRSIDLPDGSIYGNTNKFGCYTSADNYPSASEQRFQLQKRVTEIMLDSLPNTQTWCFSYDAAADTPTVAIHPNLNVTVTMGFHHETSIVSMMKRWKQKMTDVSKLSEYNYLSLPFAGQYPYFNYSYIKNSYNRIKEWGTAGNFLESGISKFANGMYIYAFNKFAKDYTNIDTTRNEFIHDMFGTAAAPITELFDLWVTGGSYTGGAYIVDNSHRYPKFLQLISDADALATDVVKQRIDELKMYMHYLILNDEVFASDSAHRLPRATNLAKYIAQITPYNIINSYASLFFLANDLPLLEYTDTAFYKSWNPDQINNGWDPGVTGHFDPVWNTIPAFGKVDIDANFLADKSNYPTFAQYHFTPIATIINQIAAKDLETKDTIHLNFGKHVYEYNIGFGLYAPKDGYITIVYDSLVSIKAADILVNFSIDSENQLYSDEVRVNSKDGISGQFDLQIPETGMYNLTFAKPTYGGGQFSIITHGNIIYRNGPFYPTFGEKVENIDEAASYFYVPKEADKVYITIDNPCGSFSCIDTTFFNDQFYAQYLAPNGDTLKLYPTADSSLFYLNAPDGQDDNFWKIFHKATNNFGMSLSTLSNYYFWLQPALITKVNEPLALSVGVSPNPTNGYIMITVASQIQQQLEVFNTVGQLMYSSTFIGQHQVNMHQFESGIYLFKVGNGEQVSYKKIVKQ